MFYFSITSNTWMTFTIRCPEFDDKDEEIYEDLCYVSFTFPPQVHWYLHSVFISFVPLFFAVNIFILKLFLQLFFFFFAIKCCILFQLVEMQRLISFVLHFKIFSFVWCCKIFCRILKCKTYYYGITFRQEKFGDLFCKIWQWWSSLANRWIVAITSTCSKS